MLKRLALVVSTAGMILTVACAESDPGITTAVKAKLAADDTVKAYQINVDTADKVVTLSGAVETSTARDHAVMLARQTDGVRDVVDRLTVNPEAAATTGDLREEINETGREAREEAREAAGKAKELGREAQTTAEDAGTRTAAVMTDAAVTSAVKTKLLADTAVAGLKIDVDTKDGMVTLNGMVPTKAEADRAIALARETSGVKSVADNLRIGR
jgi:hyperosmotically inducible periplasmic protein